MDSDVVAAIAATQPKIDWKNPRYASVYQERTRRLLRLRDHPELLPGLKDFYRQNPAEFINDFGMTFDPRNADLDRPAVIPFILMPKQREWIAWVLERWRTRTRGINEKSRDMGVTWLAIALACTLCLFREGVVVGFGSRKEEYVDEIGAMKPILPKGRMFMEHLPKEFRGDWEAWRDAPKMRINFPETGSMITGEAGDNIGRGDRTSIFFVDEAAHLPRPLLVEQSLSHTTRCRIDMSSVNGMNNPFAQHRWAWNDERVFTFDWRDDLRKDDAWYAQQVRDYDPVTVAQEVDRDYQASVEGIVIPGIWIRASIDAVEKLGIGPSGVEGLSLDVADEGADKNAICQSKGIIVLSTAERSGKGSDIFATVQWVFDICDQLEISEFDYDSDGLGAGVRGDARIINDQRRARGSGEIRAIGFRGSEAVIDPEGLVEGTRGRGGDRGRTNADYFANRKAQGWWALRRRFQRTYRRVVEGIDCPIDDMISISSKCPNYLKLVAELSQPTYSVNGVGKILIDKKPNGTKSPNLADALMIRFAPRDHRHIVMTHQLATEIVKASMRRRIAPRY